MGIRCTHRHKHTNRANKRHKQNKRDKRKPSNFNVLTMLTSINIYNAILSQENREETRTKDQRACKLKAVCNIRDVQSSRK